MRKSRFMTFLVVLCLFLFSMSMAQTKTRVTLGGSYWNANYSMVDKDGNEIGKYGTGNMFGPYLRLSHGKLNIGTSMFFGSFPVEGLEQFTDETLDLTMGRSDLNFTLGYQIIPYVNLFVGVKYLNYSYDGDISYTYSYEYWTGEYDIYGNPIYDIALDTADATVEVSEGGPLYGVGIAGVLPFGQSPLYGFASLAGMGGTLTYETKVSVQDQEDTSSEDISAALAAITLGIGYHTPSGLGLSAGYRADLFDENVESSDDEPRIHVQGLYLTLSITL